MNLDLVTVDCDECDVHELTPEFLGSIASPSFHTHTPVYGEIHNQYLPLTYEDECEVGFGISH